MTYEIVGLRRRSRSDVVRFKRTYRTEDRARRALQNMLDDPGFAVSLYIDGHWCTVHPQLHSKQDE